MQVVTCGLSAIHAEKFHSQSGHGSVHKDRPGGEGILLPGLPLHLAEGRHPAAGCSRTPGTLLLYRRGRADNAEPTACTVRNSPACSVKSGEIGMMEGWRYAALNGICSQACAAAPSIEA